MPAPEPGRSSTPTFPAATSRYRPRSRPTGVSALRARTIVTTTITTFPAADRGFSTNGDELQADVGRIDPTMTFRTRDDVAEAMGLDNADVYLHFRYWADAEQFINGPSIYEVGQGAYLTPGSARYPGDAWSARISEHEYEAEANLAYIDLRKGPFALRLGKQQVVYGEELGVQTLDQVDSLDFTKFQTFEIGAL